MMMYAQPQRPGVRQGQEVPDGALVGQAQAGDQRAFELLVHRYCRQLASYIRFFLQDDDQLANRPVLVAAGSSCFTAAAAAPDYPSALFQTIDLRGDREETQPAGVDGEKLLLPRSIALAESARC